jgi:hypothetical protein
MSATPACFENVVGLSRTDCECYGTPPSGFDTSNSGLFIDETPGLNLERIFSAANCSKDGWTILQRANDSGVKSFVNEVLMGIREGTKWTREPGRSTIGGEKGTGTVNLNKPYHGIDLVLANHIGGTATIKRIGTAMKFTGSVDVSVYEADNDTPLYTRTVSAVNNVRTWTEIDPITLSMEGNTSENPRYWFLFQPTTGQTALNYTIASCGCSGKPKWSSNYNQLESAIVLDGQNWTAWAMANGTYGTTLSDRENWTHANETQGLMLDVEFKCDARATLCSGTPDYETDPVQMSIAYGIRLAAALDVISQVTGSTHVIRDNIAGGDELELLRVSLRKDKADIVGYLVEVFTSPDGVNTYSDCFTCKSAQTITAKTMRR